MYGIYSYEERLKHPEKGFMDFNYFYNNPQEKANFWEYYLANPHIKQEIDSRLSYDMIFKVNFNKCFEEFIKQDNYYKRR